MGAQGLRHMVHNGDVCGIIEAGRPWREKPGLAKEAFDCFVADLC